MIYLEVLGKHWNPGEGIIKNYREKEQIKFHKFIAYEYIKEFHKLIDKKKQMNKNAIYSSNTWQYRNKNIVTNEILDILYNEIFIRERKNVYTIGYKNEIHKETKLKYIKLAKILEFGAINQAPKSFYRDTFKYINANIRFFYKKYKRGEG